VRIVHVVESLEVGGAEHMVVALARLQHARGHRVAIACLFREGALAAVARAAGIEVVDCGKRQGLDLRAALRLRRFLAGRSPDVLHTHNAVAHYYAVAAAAGLGIRRVLNTRHGMGASGAAGRTEQLYRFAVRFTDFGVAVCEAARQRFAEQGVVPEDKAVAIPNGIDLARIEPRSPAARRRLLAALAIDDDPVVFGSVGRLNVLKDQRTLLHAFARVHEARQGRAILIIVGEGDERASLERERAGLGLNAQVFLPGQRDDVPTLLAGFDVFVLSSRTEGYSLALVEAAAAALPIVATDVGGNREIVRDGRSGLLVPPDDPKALADAMRCLLDDAETRARMGDAGRLWALENGALESMLERYMDLYETQRAGASGAVRAGAHR